MFLRFIFVAILSFMLLHFPSHGSCFIHFVEMFLFNRGIQRTKGFSQANAFLPLSSLCFHDHTEIGFDGRL